LINCEGAANPQLASMAGAAELCSALAKGFCPRFGQRAHNMFVPLRPQSEGKKSDIAGEAGRIVCPGPTRVAFGTPATRTAVYAFALLASFKRSPSM